MPPTSNLFPLGAVDLQGYFCPLVLFEHVGQEVDLVSLRGGSGAGQPALLATPHNDPKGGRHALPEARTRRGRRAYNLLSAGTDDKVEERFYARFGGGRVLCDAEDVQSGMSRPFSARVTAAPAGLRL